MKISASKKQLAKIISENGGWRDGAKFSAQDQDGDVFFYTAKPTRSGGWWLHDGRLCGVCIVSYEVLPNWHQTIVSRDEYFHLHPAPDADVVSLSAAMDLVTDENKHEHVDSKPTIEQLAAEYRNRQDYAERKQQEADEAKADAEAKLAELVAAGKAVGLALSVEAHGPELVITDWRDLQVGDEVECVSTPNGATCVPGMFGVVTSVDGRGVEATFDDAMSSRENAAWFSSEGRCFRFVRRPAKGGANA